MSEDGIIQTRLVQPGRSTGIYKASDDGSLELIDIFLPEMPLPFDVAELPNTLTETGEYLRALLLGEISHPVHTRVAIRLLGGIQANSSEIFLIGAPVADNHSKRKTHISSDLSTPIQEQISGFIGQLTDQQNGLRWLDTDEAKAIVRQSVARFRKVKLENEREASAKPSWRPANRDGRVVGYTEVEHYTDAEYTYFQLPYRFQQYMDQHLADDERILFALSRPAMWSQLHRSWLRSQKLQEGVLIMTNQRLVFLVELVPPDSSSVRYGFDANMGMHERLHDASIDKIENDGLVLRTAWSARDGVEYLAWEFSPYCQPALEQVLSLLLRFVEGSLHSSMLQKAMFPPIPETLPLLKDPAVNDPKEMEPLLARFSAALPGWLEPHEHLLSWALLPAWFEKNEGLRVLLATNRRVRVMSDPISGVGSEIDIPYKQVTSLGYMASILSSHICLSVVNDGKLGKVFVKFPYTVESRFHTCFDVIRQCIAVTPTANNLVGNQCNRERSTA